MNNDAGPMNTEKDFADLCESMEESDRALYKLLIDVSTMLNGSTEFKNFVIMRKADVASRLASTSDSEKMDLLGREAYLLNTVSAFFIYSSDAILRFYADRLQAERDEEAHRIQEDVRKTAESI